MTRHILHGRQFCSFDAAKEGFDQSFPESDSNIKKTTKDLLDNAATYTADQETPPGDIWRSSTYGSDKKAVLKSQAGKHEQPGVDPASTTVLLFPGQGTQYIGMSRDLLGYLGVKDLYECASSILGYNLLKVSLEGPLEELQMTEKQQPAIFVASLAAVEKLKHENPFAVENCIACSGFSVGEITALTFAGAIQFEDAVRLLRVRGEAMQIASDMIPSGMMTVFYGPASRIGFACDVAKEFCIKNDIGVVDCKVANYLFPHCKVLAGNKEALQFLINNKEDFGFKRIKKLNVSGAFHTSLMNPAAEAFKEAIENVYVTRPLISVYSNYKAKLYRTPADVKKFLTRQIVNPVYWEQIIHKLYEREQGRSFPETYECGPGKSLSVILKMVNEKAYQSCHNYSS